MYKVLTKWGIGDRKIFNWVDRFRLYREESITLSQDTRARLRDLYREDILNLQDLLGRDLSKWLD